MRTLLLSLPLLFACGGGDDTNTTIRNTSSETLTQLGVFPPDEDGDGTVDAIIVFEGELPPGDEVDVEADCVVGELLVNTETMSCWGLDPESLCPEWALTDAWVGDWCSPL